MLVRIAKTKSARRRKVSALAAGDAPKPKPPKGKSSYKRKDNKRAQTTNGNGQNTQTNTRNDSPMLRESALGGSEARVRMRDERDENKSIFHYECRSPAAASRKSIPRAKQHTYIKIKHEIKSNYLPSSLFHSERERRCASPTSFVAILTPKRNNFVDSTFYVIYNVI